ncbi:MAG TPA: hypothetical protein VIW68_12600 [Candidatus Sulfotelmatobacter sp.]
MLKKLYRTLLAAVLMLGAAGVAYGQATPYPGDSRFASYFPARNYGQWTARTSAGQFTAGTYTITVSGPGFVTTPSGTTFIPFAVGTPIQVGSAAAGVQETVTPTAVSGCSLVAAPQAVCNITAVFNFGHGPGTPIISATNGLQEAINVAQANGGGHVIVDQAWYTSGGTTALITGAIPFPGVSILDMSQGTAQYWNPGATTTTVIAAPATLTNTTVGFALNGANATSGTYNGASTYHVAVACVDLEGNESQPSADFSGLTAGTGTTNQIGIAAPAQPAGGGCVGYVPYISIAGGTYALAYRVPVATYSNGVATANGVCTLTQIEKITAACAIVNTTYGQLGSNAIVSATTVNTARIWVGLGGASTATGPVVGNTNARQTYGYVPGNRTGVPALTSSIVFTANTGATSTNPGVWGTIALPPGYMNFVGRAIRVCGQATAGAGSSATIDTIELIWDADGSNATGAGVILAGPKWTNTLAATPSFNFCQDIVTTVAGSGATAGSIQAMNGWGVETVSTATTTTAAAASNWLTAVTNNAAAVGSLDLAQEARIDVSLLHTTGTDGAFTLNSISVTPLN